MSQQHLPESFSETTWFNWQQPASPFLLGPTIDACGAPFRSFFGFPFFTSIVYYRSLGTERGYQASWLLRLAEGEACGQALLDLLAVPNSQAWMDAVIERSFAAVLAAEHEVRHIALQELDDSALLDFFTSYYDRFVDFYRLGAITEPVQWKTERIVSEHLEHVVDRLGEDGWTAERVANAVFTMSEEPYTRAIDRALMPLAQEVDGALKADGQCLHAAAEGDLNARANLWARFPALEVAAIDHVNAYYWKANNYREISHLSPEEAVADLVSLANEEGSAAQALAERVARADANSRSAERDRAVVLRHLPEAVSTVVQLGDRYGSSLADRRKHTMLRALSGLDVIGRELARRTKVPYDDVLLLTPTEVEPFLSAPGSYETRWADRRRALVLLVAAFPLEAAEMEIMLDVRHGEAPRVPRKDDVSLIEGEPAIEALAQLDRQMALYEEMPRRDFVRGEVIVRPASNSLVGRCRIVTDPRKDAIEAGEILVATSTTPDFMPAIIKSGALVVDQGGVLSHAALTSRELQKPCIVGTGSATAVFKTGDRLVIDFDAGTASRETPEGDS